MLPLPIKFYVRRGRQTLHFRWANSLFFLLLWHQVFWGWQPLHFCCRQRWQINKLYRI